MAARNKIVLFFTTAANNGGGQQPFHIFPHPQLGFAGKRLGRNDPM
jgi:hypothetical protein